MAMKGQKGQADRTTITSIFLPPPPPLARSPWYRVSLQPLAADVIIRLHSQACDIPHGTCLSATLARNRVEIRQCDEMD